MRYRPTDTIERARIYDAGPWSSTIVDRCNGAFVIKRNGHVLKIIVSDGTEEESYGWEHVSVSCTKRTPTWEEMCWVKEQFWEPEEAVFQLHPKQSEYVNHHPYCLHLWRHRVVPCPAPPSILVGPKLGEKT